MHCSTSKCMQQEFEPKLPRDILKLSKNKSFYFRAKFGAIYSASKTKKYLLKGFKTASFHAMILFYVQTMFDPISSKNTDSPAGIHMLYQVGYTGFFQGAFSCDEVIVITFSFLIRWLRNFAKKDRYLSAIVRNIPISLMVNIFFQISA